MTKHVMSSETCRIAFPYLLAGVPGWLTLPAIILGPPVDEAGGVGVTMTIAAAPNGGSRFSQVDRPHSVAGGKWRVPAIKALSALRSCGTVWIEPAPLQFNGS